MAVEGEPEWIEFAVTVRAYPALTSRRGEQVCIAGLRTDGMLGTEWVRLFPYPMRDVDPVHQFGTWDVVRVQAQRTSSDRRPESMRPNPDTAEVLRHIDTSVAGWRERHSLVGHVRFPTMCAFLEQHVSDKRSLGAVTVGPEVVVTPTERPQREIDELTARAEAEAGTRLFTADKAPLEAIPWAFHVSFACPDCPDGHRLKFVDWEIHETFRNWQPRYGPRTVDMMVEQWTRMLSANRAAIFVGNMHRYPERWMAIGMSAQYHRN